MVDANVPAQVGDLADALTAIESDLAHRDTPPAGLGELKDAIDDIRLTMIGIVTATHSEDYDGSIGRLRIKRAVDLCQNLVADVIDGTVTPGNDGFERCYSAVAALHRTLDGR